MKDYSFLAIILAVILLGWILCKYREPFVPEFLDTANVDKTEKRMFSSHEQDTNHVKLATTPLPKPSGVESPFRVNAFYAYT